MAAYNGTWETSLQNILSETEANISNLKRNMTPKFESTPYIPRQMNFGIDGRPSGNYSPRASSFVPRSNPLLDFQRSAPEPNDRSTFLITSISKRVEQLEQLTSTLNNSVVTLKYENKVQNEEIKKLKDEVKHLTKRLHEKGVDLATEQKLKKWQREVRSELETIQSLMKTRSKTDEYSSLNDERGFDLPEDACQVNMENDRMRLLEAEYHNKRLLLEETDLLRRECDNMKTRILKLENEVAVVIGESKDLGMRHVRIEKDMTSVNEGYRSYSRTFSKFEKENVTLKNEVEDLRHEIESIQYDVKEIALTNEEMTKSSHFKGKPSSKWKESSKPKDFSQFRTTDGKFGSIFRKEERRYSKDNEINSFENSYDASLLSSEIDDLSLNTSLNLSDEVDPLKSF